MGNIYGESQKFLGHFSLNIIFGNISPVKWNEVHPNGMTVQFILFDGQDSYQHGKR